MNKLERRWHFWIQWCLGFSIWTDYPAGRLDPSILGFCYSLAFWAFWLILMSFINTMLKACGDKKP